jgi:MoaA/NifB/PqqE/SkfB family radical SAM enzyme
MCLVSFSKEKSYSSKNKLKDFDNTPKWAYIEITSACSHKCAWCYGEFNLEQWDYMSVSEFETVVDKCLAIGITQITIGGGEPTEHPDFEEIMSIACMEFDVNIATHGDWKQDWSGLMMLNGVKQVQFNYQGSKRHDGVHKVDSYHTQVQSMKAVKAVGIDVVGTVTVGAYNLKDIGEIFSELVALDVSRLRVWEATGYGNKFRKDKSAREIFEACQVEASKLGYTYTQSYDPDFEGDVGVACPSLSKLYMYIKADSGLVFCGIVPSERDKPFANFKTNTANEIRQSYMEYMDSKSCGSAYCMARDDEPLLMVVNI